MIEIAIRAAQEAGAIIRRNFNSITPIISYKSSTQIFTETDTEAEKVILETIREHFPKHSIFSEEEGLTDRHSDYLWVIDPLDGTTNYSNHIPLFNCSMSL